MDENELGVKSTFSAGQSACLRVGRLPSGRVRVVNDKRANRTIVASPEEWDAFMRGARSGEFLYEDLPHVDPSAAMVAALAPEPEDATV